MRPEGLYACEGCGRTFPEYVNGCDTCWDDELSIEENRRRYPRRKVQLIIGEGEVHYWGALDRPGLCQRPKTEDGRHDWLWLPDDRLICRHCAAEADALTGHVTKDGR